MRVDRNADQNKIIDHEQLWTLRSLFFSSFMSEMDARLDTSESIFLNSEENNLSINFLCGGQLALLAICGFQMAIFFARKATGCRFENSYMIFLLISAACITPLYLFHENHSIRPSELGGALTCVFTQLCAHITLRRTLFSIRAQDIPPVIEAVGHYLVP